HMLCTTHALFVGRLYSDPPAVSFFFHCSVDHRHLHSFPTRRSSDLSTGTSDILLHDTPSSVERYTPSVVPAKRLPLVDEANAKTDRKSTRLNSSHLGISYAVFCLKKKKKTKHHNTNNTNSDRRVTEH